MRQFNDEATELSCNEYSSFFNGLDRNRFGDNYAMISHSLLRRQNKSIQTHDHTESTRTRNKASTSLADTIIHYFRFIADTASIWRRALSTTSPLANGCYKKAAEALGYDAHKRHSVIAGNYTFANMLDDEDRGPLVESNREMIKKLKMHIIELEAALYGKTDFCFDNERRQQISAVHDKINEDGVSNDTIIINAGDEHIKGLLNRQQNQINQLNEQLISLRKGLFLAKK